MGGAASWLEALLRLMELEYLLRPVNVMVVKSVGRISVGGAVYELEKGTEVELPRWLAQRLAREGIVEIVEAPLGLDDIARAHFAAVSARSPADLEPLPRDFYRQAREYIEMLEERVRRELNPALLEEKQKAEMYLREIASKRTLILLHALRSPAALAELAARLAPEEDALVRTLREILDTWMEQVVGGGGRQLEAGR